MNMREGESSLGESIRADPRTYIAFSVMAGVPLMLATWAAATTAMGWLPVLIPLSVLVFAFVWVRSFEIRLSNKLIQYKTLTSGPVELLLKHVSHCSIETSYRSPWGPTRRLVIHPRPGSGANAIVINAKIFRRGDLTKIQRALDIDRS
ncbi:MAG: hypothetical protein H6R02_1304 [Burkholderiaceae bacterium]|jgi:hypothetical protein|nr:hypothetical protein [Burkholderiaceae bacterium]